MVRIFWHIRFPTRKKANLLTSDIGQRLGGREICQKLHNNQGSPPKKKKINKPAISYQPIVYSSHEIAGLPMKLISLHVTSFAFLPGFGNCRFPLATGATIIGPVAKDLLEETYPSKMGWFWEGDAVWIYILDVYKLRPV